jgi:MoaA/NifB/PqqE/SkfB family radical SAM enzyme
MINLSSKLTVFVISAGNNPNYDNCLEALSKQSCSFKLDIIKDYSPMSLAFQEMLNRCTTDYFIEIDEDMIVQSNAIEKMYNSISGTDSKLSMICYRLHDVHLDFDIYGVKIYKTDVFKKYPFDLSHPSCEMKQLEDMAKDGYYYKNELTILGNHSPLWSDELIFERYYNLLQKYRIYGYNWMGELPRKIYNLFSKYPTENNFYALAGMLLGIMQKEVITEEKNFRKHKDEFMKIKSLFSVPTSSTIYLTSNCNFECTWCKNQTIGKQTAPDVNATDVETLLLKYPSINGVCVCGFGEPLISKNLVPVLHMIRKHNKVSGIITNGSLLQQRLPELIGEHQPSYISVSLNAPNEEEHFNVTKTHTWNDIIEGIKEAVNSPIPIYISSVVTKLNIEQVPEVIKLAYRLKVKGLYLHNLLPHVGDSFWDEVLLTSDQGLIDNFKSLPESKIVLKWPVLIDKTGGYNACEFPWKSIAIDGNGSISICNSVLPCEASNGSIRDKGNVFNNAYCQKFRDDFQNNIDTLPCTKCFRNWKWM